MHETNVLLLNQNYEALGVCNVQRAIILIYLGKAEVIDRIAGQYMRSPKLRYPVPTVVRLRLYRRIPRKTIAVTKRNIFIRDKFQCQYCGSKNVLTLDHVLPKKRGGKDTWENLVAACSPCNHKKGDKSPEEAGMFLEVKPRRPSYLAFFTCFVGNVKDSWKPYLFLS